MPTNYYYTTTASNTEQSHLSKLFAQAQLNAAQQAATRLGGTWNGGGTTGTYPYTGNIKPLSPSSIEVTEHVLDPIRQAVEDAVKALRV